MIRTSYALAGILPVATGLAIEIECVYARHHLPTFFNLIPGQIYISPGKCALLSTQLPKIIMKLTPNTQILIAVVASFILGFLLQQLAVESELYKKSIFICEIIGNTFVDLLKMILIPLVFTSISVGVAHLSDHTNMHQVWKTTLIFFIFTSTLAVLLGLSAFNLFQVGAGLDIHLFDADMEHFKAQSMTTEAFIFNFFHKLFINPLAAMAHGDILAVVIFALFIGIALIVLDGKTPVCLGFLEELLAITMLIVGWIMKVAPIGILALLTKLVATQNIELLATLAQFIIVIIGTTLFHGFVVLPLVLFAFTRLSPLFFFRGARESISTYSLHSWAPCPSGPTMMVGMSPSGP
ncbi:MAG: dicarboxylate/amino acid:cation symporter [Gammaproteobacteria bacterium]